MTVRMILPDNEMPQYGGSREADVHPDEVANYTNGGWVPVAGAAASSQSGNAVKSGKLPDNFPGVISLRDAGLTTYESLASKSLENLTAIKGIGNATGSAILAALAERT
jgi:hypothetical protein